MPRVSNAGSRTQRIRHKSAERRKRSPQLMLPMRKKKKPAQMWRDPQQQLEK